MNENSGRGELGLTRGVVRVVASDPGWPGAFNRLAAELTSALGNLASAIEHVGSTSVPHLAAKPTIDIAISLAPKADSDDLTEALTPLGYQYRGDKGQQGGLLFVLEDRPEHRIAHLHAIRHDDHQWQHYLTVRERLRADPAARTRYAELKHKLATTHADNRRAYTTEKTAFIAQLLADQNHSPDHVTNMHAT